MPTMLLPTRSLCRSLALAALGLGLCALAGAATPDPHFDDAMRDYRRQDWTRAYRDLAELGERGHAPAAGLALQMWRWGPRLYGRQFHADPQRLAAWLQALGCRPQGPGPDCARALAMWRWGPRANGRPPAGEQPPIAELLRERPLLALMP